MSTEFDAALKKLESFVDSLSDESGRRGVTTQVAVLPAAILTSARLVALAIRDSKPHSGD